MHVIGVHHIAVQVRDLDRSRSFYVDVLGMTETRRQPHAVWVEAAAQPGGVQTGGASSVIVMLEKCDATDGPQPWASARQGLHLLALTIDVADRDAWKKRLLAAGAPLEKESGFTLYTRDPDGTRIGLSHHPTPRDTTAG